MSKRARPTTKPRKSSHVREVFSVRFSPNELHQLRLAAKAHGSTIASIVRRIVISNLTPRTITLGAGTTSPSSARIQGFDTPESYNAA